MGCGSTQNGNHSLYENGGSVEAKETNLRCLKTMHFCGHEARTGLYSASHAHGVISRVEFTMMIESLAELSDERSLKYLFGISTVLSFDASPPILAH